MIFRYFRPCRPSFSISEGEKLLFFAGGCAKARKLKCAGLKKSVSGFAAHDVAHPDAALYEDIAQRALDQVAERAYREDEHHWEICHKDQKTHEWDA